MLLFGAVHKWRQTVFTDFTLPFPTKARGTMKKVSKTVTEWYGTIPILRQQQGLTGWGQKMAIFADIHYYLCWRRVYGWARKSLKMCWRSMMVPILNNLNFSHKPEFFSCHVWSKKFRFDQFKPLSSPKLPFFPFIIIFSTMFYSYHS